MYNYPWMYPVHPFNYNQSIHPHCMQPICWGNPSEIDHQDLLNYSETFNHHNIPLKDYGKQPYVINIDRATKRNNTFRTAIWTGEHLQVTLMSIEVGDDISLEVHPNTDQFLRIEDGEGFVQMGDSKDHLTFQRRVGSGSAIMVPAGKWHNIRNISNQPLKLYSIYAPPEHEFGTVHQTKAEAIAAEGYHHH